MVNPSAQLRVHLIAAGGPNFMKIAPAYHALKQQTWCRPILVHTGQHYDSKMSDAFLDELGLPQPDFHLEVGSGTHAEQTGGVMIGYEKVCMEERPDWVVVVGDVNSTVACAITAKKLHLPVAHLEAGLRSNDRSMPEEINRLATDVIADLLWTPSLDADENLRREGVPDGRIDRVGNIMMDSYELMRNRIEGAGTRGRFGLQVGGYAVVTLHRPSNVDNPATLSLLVDTMTATAKKLPILFSVHPRTKARLQDAGLWEGLGLTANVILTEPLGYVDFLSLVRESKLVLTDSGGIQEETTYLGIPCLTLRENTERPITITQGTNRLVSPGNVAQMVEAVLNNDWRTGQRPELWDGKTAERVMRSLYRHASIGNPDA